MTNNNNNNYSCIILLDSSTRTLAKSISYTELSNIAYIVTDITEINNAYANMTVVLFESLIFSQTSIGVLRELKHLLNLKYILLYSNDDIVTLVSDICVLKKCDYRIIDHNLIYSVTMNDDIVFESYKHFGKPIFEFSQIANQVSENDFKFMNIMYQSLIDCYTQYNRLLEQHSNLQTVCESYEATFEKIKSGVKQLQEYYSTVDNRVSEFETRLSTDYDKIVVGEYPNKPIILYLKEFQHIPGIDILLNTIYFVVTVQYKHSCKIVKLLDSTNALQSMFIPNNYTYIQNTYNNRDILENDFILKRGVYDVFFDTLLLNRSSLYLLIVHDMRGCSSFALEENLIHTSIYCSSSEYSNIFDDVNLLTEDKNTSDLFWNSKEYNKISVKERLLKLSSHPTVTKIMDSIL